MPPAIPENPENAPKLRQGNIEGNKGGWNGVDYTEFTDAHKQKIRAHYAASVEQIDYEVGQILQSLEEQGLLENTVIIFASDHGDYLGDHNLIGKGTFYESSIHVPMIVHVPWAAQGAVSDSLVQLTDVHATLLAFAGVALPDYLDSRPMPGLGLNGESRHTHLYGIVTGGWMVYDGVWKLAKYATGEQHLFNLDEDPTEQVNRIADPAAAKVRHELDILLTQEIMRSASLAFDDRRVYTGNSMWNDDEFGKEAWTRAYPQPLVAGD
jgi:arylsulfatase A-like enzyme